MVCSRSRYLIPALAILASGCGHAASGSAQAPTTTATRPPHQSRAPSPSPPPPGPLTIHTITVFHTNHAPATGTFTASGLGASCRSGTFTDELAAPLPDGVVVNSTLTCKGGFAFILIDRLRLTAVKQDGTQTATSTWRVFDTGNGMQASGVGRGTSTGCTPPGATLATCVRAHGLDTGRVH